MKYYILLFGLFLLGCNNQPSKQEKESESITKIEVPIKNNVVQIEEESKISTTSIPNDTISLVVNVQKSETLESLLHKSNSVIDTLTLTGHLKIEDMWYLYRMNNILHLNLKSTIYESEELGDELNGMSNLKTLLLPSNIKRIAFYAFTNCPNLLEVKILDSLKHTGQDAVELSKSKFTNDFPNGNKQIHFKYKQPVNGYVIKGTLVITDYCPKLYYEEDESSVMGAVILELSKNGKQYYITHYPFYLNSSAFFGYNEFINGSYFYLNYNPDRCSLYFEDLDFDGEEELIFNHYHEGQRFNSRLVAYSLENRVGTDKQFYQRTDSPFDQIDAFTTFNKNKEEIVLFFSGGATNWEKRIYKKSSVNKYYMESPNKFNLIEIIELEGDTIFHYTDKKEIIKKEVMQKE